MSERQKTQFKAYAGSPEELAIINDWLAKYPEWVDKIKQDEREAEEAERRQKEAIEKQFKELYGLLTYEQYSVLRMGNVDEKSREQIREETGKSPEALRKIIYSAKQTLNRMSLWDKFANLFNF
jgi:hypothetical protein